MKSTPDLVSELQQTSNQNVFIMMRYRTSPHFKEIEDCIRETLSKYGLIARLAKDRAIVDDLWENIILYMRHSRFGVALFEDIDEREFNPNISLELGYMYALGKRCLLLKEKRMPRLPTDIYGRIYRDFDALNLLSSIGKQIREWCEKDLQLRPIGKEPKSLQFQAKDGLYLPDNYPDIGFYKIDRVVFSEEYKEMGIPDLGSPNNSIEWFRRNKQIYTMLMRNKKVIGYCNVMPLKEPAFQSILDGRLSDGDIPAPMVRQFGQPGAYKMYFSSVAILPKHRENSVAFRTLRTAFFNKLLTLAQDEEIYITDFVAIALNDDGRSLCTSFGMNFLKHNESHGDVYHLNLLTHGAGSRSKELRMLYNEYVKLGLVDKTTMNSKGRDTEKGEADQ